MRIEGIKDNKRSLVTSFSGAIHISQADKGYVSKLSDEFRIGDLVEARVTRLMGVDNVDLTTAEDELGVLKAMCTKCRHFMKKIGEKEVKCPNCGRKEKEIFLQNTRDKMKVITDKRKELEIEITGETHTLCNALRKALMEDEDVEAAAYVIEHPIIGEPKLQIKAKNPKNHLNLLQNQLNQNAMSLKAS